MKGVVFIDAFSRRPLFASCMLFLLVSVIGFFLSSDAKLAAVAVTALCALIVLFILIAVKAKLYHIVCVVLSTIMIITSAISSYAFFKERELLEEQYGTEHVIEACVVAVRYDSVNIDGYEIQVTQLDGKETSHKAVLDCMYDSVLEPGFVFTAKVTAGGFEQGSGSYNEEMDLLSDGIFISYTSADPSTVYISEEDVDLGISAMLSDVNSKLSRKFTVGIDGEAGALASALLLGNRRLLANTTVRDFSRAGVSHILALSGLHMSVIMGAAMLLLRKLRLNRKLIAAALLAFSLFYLVLTGCSVSATRSVIMLDVVYLSMILERRADSLTSLSVAGVLILLISPGAVSDAGFWMSFAATLGLLVYMPSFTKFMQTLTGSMKKFKILAKPLTAIASTFMASVFALIPLIAVMCVFIKELSLYSVISSAVLAIPTELLLILSLLFLPLAKVPYVSTLLASLITRLSDFMLGYCERISDMENVVISLNYPFAALAAVVIAAAIGYSLIFNAKSAPRSLIPFALSVILLFAAIRIYDASESNLVKASYVNASSTSDMIVLSSEGQAVICDIGNGSWASYSLALTEVYEARATEIQAVLLTGYSHAHNANLLDLFSREKVRQLWIPYPANEKEYHKLVPLKGIAEKHGVEVFVYESSDDFSLFEYSRLTVYRDWIDRSAVPISVISVNGRSERMMYVSPAFNELELPDTVTKMMEKTEYFIFGNKGPKTKTEYSIPTDNDAELIVFCDETRAGYFNPEGIFNTTYVLSPEKVHIYITK